MKIAINTNDQITPTLTAVTASLKPGSKESLKLRRGIAGRVETLTRDHIRRASTTRHKTANRLGAAPTNYYAKRAETVETIVTGNPDGLIMLNVYGSIFRRVDGPVSVKPVNRKYLAIPAIAGAYGRRPREIAGLKLVFLGRSFALAKVAEGTKKMEVWYWLKKGVTLPQDRGLLPSKEEYLKAADQAAEEYLDTLEPTGFAAGGGAAR